MLKYLVMLMSIAASPAWAQHKPLRPQSDVCAPIGKLADGQLVYAMSCNALPAPQTQSPAAAAAPPEPEVERGGIFGMSYTRKPSQ